MRLPFGSVRSRNPAQQGGAERIQRPAASHTQRPSSVDGDFDMRAIGATLWRKRMWIILPTLAAFALSFIAVNMMTPRYRSEARIFVDGKENIFLRPNAERAEERAQLDQEAITSQVQLVLSRALALEVIRKNGLGERPEFDPVMNGVSPIKAVLALFGIGRDPFKMTKEERVLDAYNERITAYAIDKSRVIAIEFLSKDPDLAAKVTNTIAETYLVMQQGAKQDQAKAAVQWLSGEIESLRQKVADAEARAEEFRSRSNLFVGTNNTSLSNQQLSEISTQLTNVRAQKAEAEARSRYIREMIRNGRPVEAADFLNSELMRRLSEQRVTLRAQLAEQSATLLGNHPRIKELRAQIENLDRQLIDEAGKIARSLENDARIAGARVESLSASLEQFKRQASSTNSQDIQLRALEREAKAQRDLLESYLTKYREATARENIDAAPADARIISRAFVSNTPAFPKKLPIVLIATLATLVLTSGMIASAELLKMSSHAQPMRSDAAGVSAYRSASEMPQPAAPVATAASSAQAAPPRPVVAQSAPPIQPQPVSPAPIHARPELKPAASAGAAIERNSEVDRLCEMILQAGPAARRVVVIGIGQSDSFSTSLQLARTLTARTHVVMVDVPGHRDAMGAIAEQTSAPGLHDLVARDDVSFGDIVTRDRMSKLHLVMAGQKKFDYAVLESPRLVVALDALARVYDHVVIDAGRVEDVGDSMVFKDARAVLVVDPRIDDVSLANAKRRLLSLGFAHLALVSAHIGAAQNPAPRANFAYA